MDADTRETQRQAHAGDPRAVVLALRHRLRVEPGLRDRVEVSAFLGDAVSREVLVGPAPPGEFFVGLDTLATGAASLAARLPSPGVEEVTCPRSVDPSRVRCVGGYVDTGEGRLSWYEPCSVCNGTGTLTRPRDPATEIMLHAAHDVGRAVLARAHGWAWFKEHESLVKCECPTCGPATLALDALRHHLATWTVAVREAVLVAADSLHGDAPWALLAFLMRSALGEDNVPLADRLAAWLTAAARALGTECPEWPGDCADPTHANTAAVRAALLPLAARVREGWPLL